MKRLLACLAMVCSASAAHAQLDFESVWPDQDGLSWSYDGVYWEMTSVEESFRGRLILDGYATLVPGVLVHSLVAQIDGQPFASAPSELQGLSALERALWHGHPELRKELEQFHAEDSTKQLSFWPSLLLGPADALVGYGLHRDTEYKGTWRDEIGDWGWWYYPADLTPGNSFTLQLLPDLATDVYLYGQVRTTSGSVSTAAGSWSDALVVDYEIDQGTGTIVDEQGNAIGTIRVVTEGWVAFVPEVGPVASSETTRVAERDCPNGCDDQPAAGETLSWVDLALSIPPVGVEGTSWSQLKARW